MKTEQHRINNTDIHKSTQIYTSRRRHKIVYIVYYCDWWQKLRRKLHKSDLTYLGMYHTFCTKMQTRTWGRLWMICSVNTFGIVTSCAMQSRHESIGLRPITQDKKRPRVDTVCPPVWRFQQRLPEPSENWKKNGTLNGTANLPKRCDAVIEKQRDYIEGM
jgi:hypothetical protein